jgi:ribosomal protein S18 acetylase RimI-like enzyme
MKSENQPVRERVPSVESQVFDLATSSWDDVKDAVLELEAVCFDDGGLGEDYLRELFENPKNAVVLLYVNNKLVGFTCGIPDVDNPNSFYVETTEIHPDWQGNKFITSLIGTLEFIAKERGYRYLTRHAAVGNGYAEKIARSYGDRVVESHPRSSDEYGNQMFFKISL